MSREWLDRIASLISAILTALMIGLFLYAIYYVAKEDFMGIDAKRFDQPQEEIKESELVDQIAVEEELNRLAEEKRLEEERIAKEKAEAERRERERLEKARLERERIAREKAEKERLEQERIAREKAEKVEKERLEKERIAKERAEKEQAEREAKRREEERKKAEAAREKERLEQERIAREKAEKAEQERLAKEKAERERKAQEAAAKKALEGEINQWKGIVYGHARDATSYSAYLSSNPQLYADVLVKVDRLGNIRDMRITKSSGDAYYDAEILRTLSIVNRLPMPDSEKARDIVVKEGVLIPYGNQ